MYLSNTLDSEDGRKITKLARECSTFNAGYDFWREQLFERIMKLFVWENTGEVPPHEIESKLHLAGHCGITKILRDKELTAMFGSFHGVTKYNDEWTKYNVRCPIYAGTRTIGKDVAIIKNSSLKNATFALVHHYAILLAHTEVTLVDTLVNARDAGGVPIASNEKQKQSIEQYQSRVFNGQYGAITDASMMSVSYTGADRRTSQAIPDIMQTRTQLLKAFYSDIGVRSAFEKRSNTITEEVEADTSLLMLNISDMLSCREEGAKEVNRIYGTNWTVHIAEEINYGAENEGGVVNDNNEENGTNGENTTNTVVE